MFRECNYPMDKFPFYKKEHLSKNQLYYDIYLIINEKFVRLIDIIDVPEEFGEMGLRDQYNYFVTYFLNLFSFIDNLSIDDIYI